MRKILTASVTAGLLLCAGAPVALAKPPSPRQVRQYVQTYDTARAKYGPTVGCRLVGRRGHCKEHATAERLVRSLEVLERLLRPPAPPSTGTPVAHSTRSAVTYVPAAPSAQTWHLSTPSYSGSSSSGYSIPSSIVQCESGGNWSAVNPSSGAGGAYQILPSTWQAYGGSGSPQNASPAEQSAIAAKIYAASGGSAWACK